MRTSSRPRRPLKPTKTRKVPVSAEVIASIDYKSASILKRFISDRGKILPRRHTGLTASQQRVVADHVKRARFMALLHYTADQLR